MIEDVLPYACVLLASLVATLILTPIVREINRRLGMVDKPDPRRINKVPIPRGGGIAIVIGTLVPYLLFHLISGRPLIQGVSDSVGAKLVTLSVAMSLVGLADDRFSLAPKVKLLGQVIIAVLVWLWAGLGFGDILPGLPAPVDAVLTVFWIVGAVNAFNLIDGLDGLASGLALIALLGMAGGLFFTHNPGATLPYFALAGGLIGFLRYNYNPASVFLGDSGSMFLGFLVSTMPMTSHDRNSLLVSVGVPLLAMGVPIFDTSLAILRRFLRRQLSKNGANLETGSGKVMTADSDHLHHRILRATGLNQRKTAWILYGLAAAAVAVGLVAMSLKSRAGGLWLAAVAVASVVIFKDAKIELFDAGRLLSGLAHTHDHEQRRHFASMTMPMYLFFDIASLVAVFFVCIWALDCDVDLHTFRCVLPVHVVSVFAFMIFFRVYNTAWSRAFGSNYNRLFFACVFGSLTASVFLYYWPAPTMAEQVPLAIVFALLSFLALLVLRRFRGVIRDLYYALDCSRIKDSGQVSRVLVYGAGLRYRAFHRELVRHAASNARVVIGLLDDNIYLKGKYIGGVKVLGTINEAPSQIRRLNVSAVVICCEISPDWLKVVKDVLRPTGVAVTQFVMSEQPL